MDSIFQVKTKIFKLEFKKILEKVIVGKCN